MIAPVAGLDDDRPLQAGAFIRDDSFSILIYEKMYPYQSVDKGYVVLRTRHLVSIT